MKTTQLIMLAAAAGFAASAMAAPQSVGTFSAVQGAVTVSTADAVQRAEDGMRVADGAGIMVSSDGAATVALDNGCAITLPGSSYLALDASLPCDELQAAAEPLFESYQQASLGDSYLMAQAPVSAGIPAAQVANDSVAELDDVHGAVTVSDNDNALAGVDGMRLMDGALVAVPAGGEALIRFDKGCDIKLEGGQQLVIDSGQPCGAIIASGGGAAAGGIGGMTAAQTGMAIVGGGVLAAAIFSNSGSSHRGPISGE